MVAARMKVILYQLWGGVEAAHLNWKLAQTPLLQVKSQNLKKPPKKDDLSVVLESNLDHRSENFATI